MSCPLNARTLFTLYETIPPDIGTTLLRPWVQITPSPNEEPKLRATTDGGSLLASAVLGSSDQDKPQIDSTSIVVLDAYDKAEEVRAEFKTLLGGTAVFVEWRAGGNAIAAERED